MSHNICSHRDCKNDNKNVSRWELTDSRGYSCGIVCNDCHDKQKAKYRPDHAVCVFMEDHEPDPLDIKEGWEADICKQYL